MKKTTAIIFVLILLVIALASALVYQITKEENIVVNTPTEIVNKPSKSGEVLVSSGEVKEEDKEEDKYIDESGEKLTQIASETAIVQEEIKVEPSLDTVKPKETFDLIVFGAEPEGIAAAVAASRVGLKTLLVEDKDGPGGFEFIYTI